MSRSYRKSPTVIVHADPAISPWIDRADLCQKRGALLVWEDGQAAEAQLRAGGRPSPASPHRSAKSCRAQTIRPTHAARVYVGDRAAET